MINQHARPRTLHDAEAEAAQAERHAQQMRLAKRKEDVARMRREIDSAAQQRFFEGLRRREKQQRELAELADFVKAGRQREELAAHAVTSARENARLDAQLEDRRMDVLRSGKELPDRLKRIVGD